MIFSKLGLVVRLAAIHSFLPAFEGCDPSTRRQNPDAATAFDTVVPKEGPAGPTQPPAKIFCSFSKHGLDDAHDEFLEGENRQQERQERSCGGSG